MRNQESFFRSITNPREVVTAIPAGLLFPESLGIAKDKYDRDIELFGEVVRRAESSAELLEMIRSPDHPQQTRMSFLKLYRRCVSLIMDTETTKNLKNKTKDLVEAYGIASFKPIGKLKKQFADPSPEILACLAALLAENDFRGAHGYLLTEQFFDWFEAEFLDLSIKGPRRAGRDVELTSVFPDYAGDFPCDFVIWPKKHPTQILAIGFARYDSTRGGSQSDDRTGGNANKVDRAEKYCETSGRRFRIIFLADGPGLTHKDTWKAACDLDGGWGGNVRVTTLKLAQERVTRDWLFHR